MNKKKSKAKKKNQILLKTHWEGIEMNGLKSLMMAQ